MSDSNIGDNKNEPSPIKVQLTGSFVKDGKQYLILNQANEAGTNVSKHNQQNQSLLKNAPITFSVPSNSVWQAPSQQMKSYSKLPLPLPHAPLSYKQPNAANKSPSKVLVYPSLQQKAKESLTGFNKPNDLLQSGNLALKNQFFNVPGSSATTFTSSWPANFQSSKFAAECEGDIRSGHKDNVQPRVSILKSAAPRSAPIKILPNVKSVMQPVVPVKLVPSVLVTNADGLTKTDSIDHDYIVRPTSLPILNFHAMKRPVSAVKSNPVVSSSVQKEEQDEISRIVIKKVETLKTKDVSAQPNNEQLSCVPNIKMKMEATSLGKVQELDDFSNITVKKEVCSPLKPESSEEATFSESNVSFAGVKIKIEPDCTETLIQHPVDPTQTKCDFSSSDAPDFYTTVESKHKTDITSIGENIHVSKSHDENEFVNVWDTDDDYADDVLLELLQSSVKETASTRKTSQLPIIHNDVLIRPCYVKLERCDGFIAAGTSNAPSTFPSDKVPTIKKGRTVLVVNSSDVKVKDQRPSNAKALTMYKFKIKVSSGKLYELAGQLVRIKGREGLFLHSLFNGKALLFPASTFLSSTVGSSSSRSNLPASRASNSLHVNAVVSEPSSVSSSHATTPLSHAASTIKTGTSPLGGKTTPLPSATAAMCVEGGQAQAESAEGLSESGNVPSKLQKCEEALESSQGRIRRLKELLKKQEAELEELRTKNLFSNDS